VSYSTEGPPAFLLYLTWFVYEEKEEEEEFGRRRPHMHAPNALVLGRF
jgi:hypothetical protein